MTPDQLAALELRRPNEFRPIGARRWLNRLMMSFRQRGDGLREDFIDLSGQAVELDGHAVTQVSRAVARDLLDHPFAKAAEQAHMLQRILHWAKDMGGYYEVGIVRTRLLGPTTVAALRIERVTTWNGQRWSVFWWFEA